MALSADQITAKNFKEFYEQIRPYLGGTLGYADCPVGTILAFGGSRVPNGWFSCQGQELLIADYPTLYSIIGDNFGTASSGTKFKLPDLRGEFLRGAGTNSRSGQGSGGVIGAHQNGTEHKYILADDLIGMTKNVAPTDGSGRDANHNVSNVSWNYVKASCLGAVTNWSGTNTFTSRPTNTSVNFIIKAKRVDAPADFKDYVDEQMSYSTEEKVVGKWINGKPLYQKTFNTLTTPTTANTDTTILTLDPTCYIKSFTGLVGGSIPINYYGGAQYHVDTRVTGTGQTDCNRLNQIVAGYLNQAQFITVQYTKSTD